MNREEQILKAAREYNSGITLSSPSNVIHFENGVKWADEHPVDVWHETSEEPKDYLTQILYQDKYGICWTASKQEKFEYDWDWEHFATAHLMVRWAYINDLLPKGGKE